MAKKAVLIGINYPGTDAKLQGCVNDVKRMKILLTEHYGFSEGDITMMIDTDETYTQPIGKNIRLALLELVGTAKAGDVLVVHYSGHGTRVEDKKEKDDDTGFDECIVPSDFNLITDDEFRELVDKVPQGCTITIISDSCNSGGLIEAKEQIGDSTKKKHHGKSVDSSSSSLSNPTPHDTVDQTKEIKSVRDEGRRIVSNPRFLPLPTLVDILKQKTGKDDIDIGKLKPALFDIFGEDSNLKVMKKGVRKAKPQDQGILISGCQTYETSADANPTGLPDDAYGALSNAIQEVVGQVDGKIRNYKLVKRVRKLLKEQDYSQNPGLYCSDSLAKAQFVCKI